MTDLASVAEYSNWLSIVSVLTCFLAMFFFILKLIGEDLFNAQLNGGVTRVTYTVPQINVRPVKVPISVKITNESQAKVSCFTCQVTCDTSVLSFDLRSYWGVSIRAFHYGLRRPWTEFVDAFHGDDLFGPEGHVGALEMQRHIRSSENLEVSIEKPTTNALNLGPLPREVYPIVLVCLPVHDGNPPSDIGASISVIHVRDEICRISTQILYRYLKHRSGRSTALQSIFVSDEIDDEDSGMCIVCSDLPITRVMMPCKHACVCQRCFHRLNNRCPMCRTFIQSFFLLQEEPKLEEAAPTVVDETPMSLRERLRELNHRFAMAMGLQENL